MTDSQPASFTLAASAIDLEAWEVTARRLLPTHWAMKK